MPCFVCTETPVKCLYQDGHDKHLSTDPTNEISVLFVEIGTVSLTNYAIFNHKANPSFPCDESKLEPSCQRCKGESQTNICINESPRK